MQSKQLTITELWFPVVLVLVYFAYGALLIKGFALVVKCFGMY